MVAPRHNAIKAVLATPGAALKLRHKVERAALQRDAYCKARVSDQTLTSGAGVEKEIGVMDPAPRTSSQKR